MKHFHKLSAPDISYIVWKNWATYISLLNSSTWCKVDRKWQLMEVFHTRSFGICDPWWWLSP